MAEQIRDMFRTQIVCISGKAQHGKDTTASILREELIQRGYKVLVIHHADLLKFMARSMFEWDGQKDENGRHLLQYIGTDIVLTSPLTKEQQEHISETALDDTEPHIRLINNGSVDDLRHEIREQVVPILDLIQP